MATSSMHKPGWRSRRRSRLSLVERAVPRLGRLPGADEGTKTTLAEEARKRASLPPKGHPPVRPDAMPGPEARGEDAPVDTRVMAAGERDAADAGSLAAAEHGELQTGGEAALEPAAPNLPKAADTPDLQSDVGVTDVPDDAHVDMAKASETTRTREEASPIEPVMPPDAATLARDAATEDETASMAGEPEANLLSSALMTSPRTMESAGFEADEAAPAEHPGSTGPRLALDWDSLIENGYTDPRDRGRPLPRNMDEIIRVLIRQALSDQSSWRDRVVLVTSPNERTSKTTAAINFAFGVTTVSGHHAVLVDVDTTGPGAVDRLGGGDLMGITAALADESIAIDDLVIGTDLDRLTLVASGTSDEDTLDRFASRRMLQILRHLTDDPDTLLIIDAPPILQSQEAAVLSVIAGQVVLAVEAGRTTADQIEHALQRIGDRHNVSLVLNESSGMVAEDTVPLANAHAPLSAKRRAPGASRRPFRTAAASLVAALGLTLTQQTGQAFSTGVSSTAIISPADAVALAERCSDDTETDAAASCRVGK